MAENKFTPESLSASNLKFTIPLYQRLFEWDYNEITQLLNDLLLSFKKDNSQPYYIGMLTVYEEKSEQLSLVDGQQRFSVLTLFALAIGGDKWSRFLTTENGEKRLSFFARKHDTTYLQNKIRDIENKGYVNKKMEIGISVIKKFMNSLDESDRVGFKDYILKSTTFFISKLPKQYASQDLNRYFEAMNAAGRSLENHEILKVNLLKLVDKDYEEYYTRIWNAVSEMDKCLIRQKTWDKEKVEDYRKRISKALNTLDGKKELFELCNYSTNAASSGFKSIREITADYKPPAKMISSSNERAILSFSEFLLQVLWLQLSEEDRCKNKSEFFNVHKLQQTFTRYLPNNEVNIFFDNLLKYRILFDQFILRISYVDQYSNTYLLKFQESETDTKLEYKRLLQFQSMLYVSTSSYLWLGKTLIYLENNVKSITSTDYLHRLKKIDNDRHKIDTTINLSYGLLDRYWFWRLDYYLWENLTENFDESSVEIANKYVFRANRSIEHIAPQNPKSPSKIKIDNDLLHSFGNLVMISAGQNSSLQNESYEVKRAHVEAFINGRGGSIESLKMLKLYKFNEWSAENIKQHEIEMMQILVDSYPSNMLDSISILPAIKESL